MQVQSANVNEQATVTNVNTFGTTPTTTDGVSTDDTTDFAGYSQQVESVSTDDQGQNDSVSLEEFAKLKASNDRLLEESKKWKSRTRKAEEEKLMAENNKDEIIRRQKQQLDEIDQRLMAKAISESVSKEAMKRNCKHWDHLLSVGNTDMLEYDPETEAVTGVREFFDYHENNEDYDIYFRKTEPVKTITDTQTTSAQSIDYKANPIGYLREVKKNSPEKFNDEVRKLQSEGLIS